MPEGEQQKEKREWHMDKKPPVQPMMKPNLQIEHPALVTPGFDFIDPAAITFRDA